MLTSTYLGSLLYIKTMFLDMSFSVASITLLILWVVIQKINNKKNLLNESNLYTLKTFKHQNTSQDVCYVGGDTPCMEQLNKKGQIILHTGRWKTLTIKWTFAEGEMIRTTIMSDVIIKSIWRSGSSYVHSDC